MFKAMADGGRPQFVAASPRRPPPRPGSGLADTNFPPAAHVDLLWAAPGHWRPPPSSAPPRSRAPARGGGRAAAASVGGGGEWRAAAARTGRRQARASREPRRRAHDWQDGFYQAMLPFVGGGAYQNFPDPSLADWRRRYYGANLD